MDTKSLYGFDLIWDAYPRRERWSYAQQVYNDLETAWCCPEPGAFRRGGYWELAMEHQFREHFPDGPPPLAEDWLPIAAAAAEANLKSDHWCIQCHKAWVREYGEPPKPAWTAPTIQVRDDREALLVEVFRDYAEFQRYVQDRYG